MDTNELRTIATALDDPHSGWEIAAIKVRGAAAEIERLNLELIAAKPLYSRRQIEAENERLRAALRSIDDAAFGYECRIIARNALQQNGDGK